MSKTIDDFNGFFRKDKKRIDFRLAFETKEALSLISETLRTKGIEVTFSQELNPVITGFANEYKQVVLNLLSNAKDALETKQSPQKSQINISISSDQTYGILKVSDNAGGIPKNAIDKIFEPYFTTKPEGKGTGIGLYMSKTIVETNMGGSIKAYNEENGATFVVKLPLAVSSLEGK